MKILKRTYIEYDNTSNQWNNGVVSVYIKDELIEYIFVDDSPLCVDDIIDNMKEKYNITKVKEIRGYDWR